jgi:hypothetical protein
MIVTGEEYLLLIQTVAKSVTKCKVLGFLEKQNYDNT